jgi:hypothetical protein
MESLSAKIIEDKILNNYIDYSYLFIKFQSKFLSGLYSRYQNLDNGKLILHFTKETHQDILREKEYDLNFNISYEKFWENHHKIKPRHRSIIKIAEDTLLPKETARRKILQLINQKVLNKKNKNIGWLPSEQYKQNYNLFINKEIEDVGRLISFVCKKLNYSIAKEEVSKEIKEKFSFYWFHYLDIQLSYLKIWNRQFKDLELVLILLQVTHLFTSKVKEKNLSNKNLFDDPSLLKDFISVSISATSISEVTSIPRATCVRKLETLVKLKIVSQDTISKRYYLIPTVTAGHLIPREIAGKIVKLFSEFFFIFIKTMNLKI